MKRPAKDDLRTQPYLLDNAAREASARFDAYPLRERVLSDMPAWEGFISRRVAEQWLDGADLRDTKFLGADLRGTSFYRCDLRNACLAYALIDGARFDKADLDGADLLYTNIKRARFDGAIISNTSTIPGIYACGRREW